MATPTEPTATSTDPTATTTDPTATPTDLAQVPLGIPNTQDFIDVETLRRVLASFWVPFVNTCAIECSIVPVCCVDAQPDQRWRVFISTFANSCCQRNGDLIRASSVAIDVWKIVSTKSYDLKRATSLYNPFMQDMSEIFRLRANALRNLMLTPLSDFRWTRLLVIVNGRIRRRDVAGVWQRCSGECVAPSFRLTPFHAMALINWSIALKSTPEDDS